MESVTYFSVTYDNPSIKKQFLNFEMTWNSKQNEEIRFTYKNALDDSHRAHFIDKDMSKELLEEIRNHLKEHSEDSFCFLLSQPEMTFTNDIKALDEDFPFAQIGTVIKPTQYSSVEQFVLSHINKNDGIKFDVDEEWDIDLDLEDDEVGE